MAHMVSNTPVMYMVFLNAQQCRGRGHYKIACLLETLSPDVWTLVMLAYSSGEEQDIKVAERWMGSS